MPAFPSTGPAYKWSKWLLLSSIVAMEIFSFINIGKECKRLYDAYGLLVVSKSGCVSGLEIVYIILYTGELDFCNVLLMEGESFYPNRTIWKELCNKNYDFRGFGVYNPLVSTLPHPPDTATVDGWRVQLVCSLDIWVPLTSTSSNSGRSFSSWDRSDLFNFGETSQLVTEIPPLTWSTF